MSVYTSWKNRHDLIKCLCFNWRRKRTVLFIFVRVCSHSPRIRTKTNTAFVDKHYLERTQTLLPVTKANEHSSFHNEHDAIFFFYEPTFFLQTRSLTPPVSINCWFIKTNVTTVVQCEAYLNHMLSVFFHVSVKDLVICMLIAPFKMNAFKLYKKWTVDPFIKLASKPIWQMGNR